MAFCTKCHEKKLLNFFLSHSLTFVLSNLKRDQLVVVLLSNRNNHTIVSSSSKNIRKKRETLKSKNNAIFQFYFIWKYMQQAHITESVCMSLNVALMRKCQPWKWMLLYAYEMNFIFYFCANVFEFLSSHMCARIKLVIRRGAITHLSRHIPHSSLSLNNSIYR